MADRKVRLPDGKIGLFRADQSDAEIKSLIQQQYPEAYNTEEPSVVRQLGYGFWKDRSDIGNWGDYLESYIPLGTFFNPTETYGAEFMSMTPEQRREFLTKRRQAMVEKEYADVIGSSEKDSLAVDIGSFGSALATPTSLAPIGKGYKAVAAMSAFLGAQQDIAQQLMSNKEYDPIQTAKMAGFGAAIGTGSIAAGRYLKNKLKRKQDTATATEMQAANAKAIKLNELVHEAHAAGVVKEEIPAYIQKHSGMTPEEIAETFALSETKAEFPSLTELNIAEDVADNGMDTISRVKSGILQDIYRPIADRIETISPRLALRLRNVDKNSHVKIKERLDETADFVKAFNKLDKADKRNLKSYLLNGQFDDAVKLMDKVKGGKASFEKVTNLLNNMHKDLVDAGYTNLTKLENYFPRKVLDLKALEKSLGKQASNIYKRAIAHRKAELNIPSHLNLPAAEQQRILNEVAMGKRDFVTTGVSFAKPRNVDIIRDDQLDMYADPLEGLFRYIRSATNNAEKRRFFSNSGKSVGNDSAILDLDESVGKIIYDELKDIDPDDASLITSMLKARFTTGEVSPTAPLQAFRSVTYMAKLANPLSAVTQLQDLSNSVWINGVWNTLSSILGPGSRKMTMQKFGLDQHLAEEFANDTVLSKALHKMFTASGFRKLDKFGKNVFINSTLKKVTKLAQTEAGIKKLSAKHAKEFGSEWQSVVNNLKSGNLTENVKLLLWSELAKTQPISLSEMPLKYLQSPNGRIAYAMKTFAAKQLSNFVRRVPDEFRKGNKAEAVKNLLTWAATVPTAGMAVGELKSRIKYFGQDMPGDQYGSFTDAVVDWGDNALKLYGASEYMLNNIATGKPETWAGGLTFFAPGLSTLGAVKDTLGELASGEEIDPKILKELPVAGQLYYYWLGGGIEADYEKAMNREIKRRSER